MPSENPLHGVLMRRCEVDRKKGLTMAILQTLNEPANQLTLLAVFYHDMYKGGFEHFIYNANGVYLPEVLEVLGTLKAHEAAAQLDKAIQYCIDESDAYQVFLQGDFSDSPFKTALSVLSDESRAAEVQLLDEIAAPLKKLLRRA